MVIAHQVLFCCVGELYGGYLDSFWWGEIWACGGGGGVGGDGGGGGGSGRGGGSGFGGNDLCVGTSIEIQC